MKTKLKLVVVALVLLYFSGCRHNPNADAPKTPIDSITDDYFGTTVADPYRWLEDGSSHMVKKWIADQNTFTDKILSSFPEGNPITKRIETLSITSVEQFSPELINGKLFFMQYTPPQAQPVIAYKDWPDGKIKILVDPNKIGNNVAITDFWPY